MAWLEKITIQVPDHVMAKLKVLSLASKRPVEHVVSLLVASAMIELQVEADDE